MKFNCFLPTRNRTRKLVGIVSDVQQVMRRAGIDVNVPKPHSVRSAATSKAKGNNASLTEIMKNAGWSSAATFVRFYDKQIDTNQSFATSVLV